MDKLSKAQYWFIIAMISQFTIVILLLSEDWGGCQ